MQSESCICYSRPSALVSRTHPLNERSRKSHWSNVVVFFCIIGSKFEALLLFWSFSIKIHKYCTTFSMGMLWSTDLVQSLIHTISSCFFIFRHEPEVTENSWMAFMASVWCHLLAVLWFVLYREDRGLLILIWFAKSCN